MTIIENDVWDFVVVGSGVLGLSTAYYLKKSLPNAKILLMDKYPGAGYGNTGKSNAAFRNIFDTSLNIHLSSSTMDFFRTMEEQEHDLGLKEVGYLWLLTESQFLSKSTPSINIETENGQKEVSLIEFMNINNIEYEIFNKEEISNLLPSLENNFKESTQKDEKEEENIVKGKTIQYGLLGKQCGSLVPDLVVNLYQKLYKDLNGETRYNSEVLEILLKEKGQNFDEDYFPTVYRDSETGGIKVKDRKKKSISIIQTKKLILTTGAWMNQLLDPLGINSGVKPKKRQLFRICGLNNFVSSKEFDNKHQSIPFTILPIGGVFIKPIPEAKCVDVGCSDEIGRRFETRTMEESKKGSMDNRYLDNPQGELEFYITNVLPVLETYFPTIFNENTKIDNPSAGMYSYSLDKYPIIEKNSKLGNLYFCSGTSGSGIMKSDAIARILVSLTMDEEYSELFDKTKVKVSDFSINDRNLPKETLVL